MINITEVVQAMIALVTALLSVVVVPWLRTKFDAEEMKVFLRWVEIGVAAAEQLYAVHEGEQKRLYVMQYLRDKGYTTDVEDIENAIEAAVLQLHKELYYD
ncbi:MAG: holin [Oscillospiraceae bacterium]|nr:holin [Oscillospiraceae bacterium]